LTEPPAGRSGGLFHFAIEGRHAPALFVTGWLATVVGLGVSAIGFLAVTGALAAGLLLIGLGLLSAGLILLGGSQTIERAAAARPYAGPSPIIVFGAVLTTSLFAALVVGIPLELAGVKVERPVGNLLTVALQAAVFLGIVRLMVVGPGAISWRDMGLLMNARRVAAALASGAIFAPVIVLVTALLAVALVRLVGVSPESPLPRTGTSGGLLLNLVSGAVIAPFSEEILFRGVALTAWARTNRPAIAILRAALLFVVAHVLLVGGRDFGEAVSLAFVGAAGRLPVALALGWLYVRSGTVWAPIGLHAVFNAILIVLSETAPLS
jgi:membrane protease YdiL (CAAX protease family)